MRSLCFDWTPARAYARCTCATLILHGDRSPGEEQRVCELLAEAMPRAERRVIAGAGHLGAAQRGRELGPTIAAWLRSQLPP